MRALILVAGAALAVAACSSNDNANNTMNADMNATNAADTANAAADTANAAANGANAAANNAQ